MKNKIISIILILITAFLFNSCNNKSTDTIKIGALLSFTGSGANYGKSLRQGIDIAVQEINSKGGINGKNLEIVYEDAQTDAKIGVSGFQKLISIDRVPLVIGSISSVVLATAPIADKNHVVLLNSSAMSPKICENAQDYLFSVMVNGRDEADFMANYILDSIPNSKVAILYSNNSSGVDTKDYFSEKLKEYHINIAIEEGYNLGETDFKTSLTKIKNSKADICYLIAFSSKEFADILKQSKELNLGIQWYSYSGFETKETIQLSGDAANGILYSYPVYSKKDTLFNAFQSKYNTQYNSWADIYTVTSYDAIYLVTDVIKKYGYSVDSIKSGLEQITNYDGIFGEIEFGDIHCIKKELMWKTVKNNNYEILD